MNDEALKKYESRIAALEVLCLTKEEKEINDLIIRIVKSMRSTLWLINGGVKYLVGPAGVAIAIWAWGANIVDWVLSHISGGIPK